MSIRESQTIAELFGDENTIPFLCRYRRELIGHRSPEQMRDIQESLMKIETLRGKIQSSLKTLEKSGKLDEALKKTISSVRSMGELELICAPYKTTRTTLAEKARGIGLEGPTRELLFEGKRPLDLKSFVKPSTAGLESEEKVLEGMRHIASDMVMKTPEILQQLREFAKDSKISIQSKRVSNDVPQAENFDNYSDVTYSIASIKPHQVLAINRGENLKILKVSVKVPEFLESRIKYFVRQTLLSSTKPFQQRTEFFEDLWKKLCYPKKIEPLIVKLVRSSLTEQADKSSVEVFAKNLKDLLLSPPVKGHKILGIDPGFRHGSKCALISEQNSVLETAVLMFHTDIASNEEKLYKLLKAHQCTLIALGNGKGCREVEKVIAGMIERKRFHSPNVKYCIVNEQGASIYSCSEEARKEFPDLDINVISAVSIARRLNDPLAEYVKIDAKHLGVGMYQHDVTEKDLSRTLDEVVTDCVSRVGVDINTTSECLLRRIAGLTQSRAAKIVDFRESNGPFQCRQDILNVPSIGKKTFTQLAGFIRIERNTSGGAANKKFNELDLTWVHPESYGETKKLLKQMGLKEKDIGTDGFLRKIKGVSEADKENFREKLKISSQTLESILEALGRDIFKDYREDVGAVRQFKSSIQKMSDLKVGTLLTGVVTNVTHFGSFVDIGVEKDALIHVSKLGRHKPSLGGRVEVKVLSVDVPRQRVNLQLEDVL